MESALYSIYALVFTTTQKLTNNSFRNTTKHPKSYSFAALTRWISDTSTTRV